MKKYFIILTLTLLFSNNSKACLCSLKIDFIATLNNNISSNTAIVMGYKIIDTLQNGIGCKYKIIQHIYGQTISDTLTIWGDPGWTCYAKPQFNLGDTTIVMLNKVNYIDANIPYMNIGDYTSSYCYYTMLVKGDSIFGGNVMSFTFNGFPLNTFIDSINSTINTILPVFPNLQTSQFTLFPNPTKNLISINSNEKIEWFEIYNIQSQMINKYFSFNKLEIDLSTCKNGIYFYKYLSNGKIRNGKFQKE